MPGRARSARRSLRRHGRRARATLADCAATPVVRRVYAAAVLLVLALSAVPEYPAEKLDRRELASTRILDREGRLLYEQRSEVGGYGRWVELDEIAPELALATLSGEDAAFYGHSGIDPVGVARAAWLNLREGRLAYGGSTITQQLAKLVDPQPRTLGGKAREALDALSLERTLDKRDILTQYLNRAYYGRQAYGVEAAAQRFFGKPARDLSLDESALLAILPRGPTAYDPARHPERAKRRRAHVLARMAERGWIEEDEATRAAEAPIRLVDPAQRPEARHLLDHLALSGLIEPGTPEVRTTLDLELQRRLEARVRMHLLDVEDRAVSQAGVVVLDNATGEVLAMVGSRRYGEEAVAGAVNVTTAPRHPGSALKPFVYALAMERGAHPGTPVLDVPTEWPDYHPRSLDGEHRGIVSYREALGGSLNVPAVRVAERVGVEDLTATLRAAGLDTVDPDPSRHGLALALGGDAVRLVDLAAAYATLANGGRYRAPAYLRDDARPREGRRVLSEQAAWQVTDILADARARRAEFGIETPLELPFEAAVKTGTSQSFCDNVVVGYTPEVTVAAWAGNFDGRPMHGLLSMVGAAPLWRDAMLAAMEGRDRRAFARPAGVEPTRVCSLSGMAAGPHCPHTHLEEIAVAHGPGEPCRWHGPEGLAVPAEAHAHGYGDRALPAEPGEAAVAILSPAAGATFVLDPLLARDAQRVPLRAAVGLEGVERLRWEIDGSPVADATGRRIAFWTPTPGPHRLRAVAVADGREVAAEIDFNVETPRGGS